MDREIKILRTVSAEELARRQKLKERILKLREKANIAPLTTAELVRQVRKEASGCDDTED